MKWSIKYFLVTSFVWSFNAWSDYSGNHCVTRRSGSVPSICAGRVIPASKARNISPQKLMCSSNIDHYIRRPQKYDLNKWLTLAHNNKTQEAFEYRQSLPKIQWEGSVPFQTVEVWTWESCDYVTSSFHCGSTTKYRTVDCSYTTPLRCDQNGQNCSGGDYVSQTCQESYQDPNSCHADISYSEDWACSSEIMTYSAEYVRPPLEQWNPKTPGYKDPIPNKYDLLPGEVEDVQTANNGGFSTEVSPKVKIGDAWNDYQIISTINGGSTSTQCIQNGSYKAVVKIHTKQRIPSKKTPNAFRLPHDARGTKMNALKSETVTLKSGEEFELERIDDSNYIAGRPSSLLLDDTSTSMISLIAEQSRSNEAREKQKEELGLGSNKSDAMDDLKKDPGFFKNTKVKVELIKDNKYWWNTSSTNGIIVDDIDAVQMDYRAFSNSQEIAFSDLWEIALNDPSVRNNNIYMTGKSSERKLIPNKKYILKVSMYQKGVKDFYKQDCEEDAKAWDCKWWSLFLHRDEDDYFSDPLEIHFKTPEMKDERGLGRKIGDLFDWF